MREATVNLIHALLGEVLLLRHSSKCHAVRHKQEESHLQERTEDALKAFREDQEYCQLMGLESELMP